MDKKPLQIKEFTISKMPGLRSKIIQLKNISPHINIVYGPNASGKTTTSKALQRMIWGSDTSGYELSGNFQLSDDNWRVDIESTHIIRQKNGVNSELIGLPPHEVKNRYLLDLKSLLIEEDASLAQKIDDETNGGVNLKSAKQSLGYDSSPEGISKNAEIFKQKQKDYQDQENKQINLKNKEGELNQKNEELKKIREAGNLVGFYKLLKQFLQANHEYKIAKSTFESFPEEMENIRQEDEQNIQNAEEKFTRENDVKTKIEDKIKGLEKKLKNLQSNKTQIPTEKVEEIRHQIKTLENLEKRLSEIKTDTANKKGKKDEIIRSLNIKNELNEWKKIDLKDLESLEDLIRETLEIFSKKVESESQISRLKDQKEQIKLQENDSKKLQDEKSLLINWIEAKLNEQTEGYSFSKILIGVLIGFIAGSFVLTAILLSQWFYFFGIFVLLFLFLLQKNSTKKSNDTQSIEDNFKKLQPNTPNWSIKDVSSALENLNTKQQLLEKNKLDFNYLENRIGELNQEKAEIDRKVEEILKKQSNWVEKLQINPGFEELNKKDVNLLLRFFKQIDELQKTSSEIEGLSAEQTELVRQIDDVLQKINDNFKKYGFQEGETSAEAQGILKTIEEELREIVETQTSIQQNNERLLDTLRNIQNHQNTKDEIFTRIGIAENEKYLLQKYTQEIPSFLKAKEEKSKKKAQLNTRKDDLKNNSLYEDYKETWDENTPIDQIDDKIRHFELEAAGYTKLFEEIKEIEAEINQIKGGNSLENALTKREEALDKVEEVYHATIQKMTGNLIIDNLKNNDESYSKSDIMKRADELFSKFTNHNYQLILGQDEKSSVFRAFDIKEKRGLSLDELSSGTRVQLILAVRLAYLESQENDIKLPLIADELLANTDDIRMPAIIETLLKISEDGRQIFYFTAQQDEVSKWKNIIKQSNSNVKLEKFQLEEEKTKQFLNEGNSLTFKDKSIIVEIPSPKNLSREAYKNKLKFDEFNILHDAVSSIHLWYLIEDLEVLYNCLTQRINTWGQLASYLKFGNIEGLTNNTIEGLKQKIQLLTFYQELEKIGKEKKIDREILENSGAVSESFIDTVSEFLKSINNSPSKLIKGLSEKKVSGFRENKAIELEEYLLENDFLPAQLPLSANEIANRLNGKINQMQMDRELANDFLNFVKGKSVK